MHPLPPGLTLRPRLIRPGGAQPSLELVRDHLAVGLMVEEDDALRRVTVQDLADWRTSLEKLLPLALEQLRQDSPSSRWQPVSSAPGTRLFLSGDGESASRMLIMGHLLQAWPLGGVIVACPSADQFLCVPLDSVEDLEAIHVLATATRFAHQVAREPLSDQVFWNDGSQWHHLLVRHTDQAVEIDPPPEFLATIGRLAAVDLVEAAAEA